MRRRTAIVYDPIYLEHQPGPGHPESPLRCGAVLDGIAAGVESDLLVRLAPRRATEDEVALCHSREYIETAREDIASGMDALSTGDTNVSRRSFEAALFAVGGVLTAADAVAGGEAANAFCVVRPPGHHAGPARGMGFCIFNNIAVGARYALRRGFARVLIVDWDVHHGNGTQDIFYEDPSVLYFSVHQWPLYPGTGRRSETGTGPGAGTTVNCPLAVGSGRAEVMAAFREQLRPAAEAFRPEFVFVSAGFDAMGGDPIAGLTLTALDFAEMTDFVAEIAGRHAGGRLVSALEGGYALDRLRDAAGAHVRRLAAAAAAARPATTPLENAH
jgi:acetoin utilization deacetylase AcuC-like enzyme